MSEIDTRYKTVDELINLAGSPNHLYAQQAQAEMNRRLIEALNDAKQSSDRFNRIMTALTILLSIVALAQLTFTSETLPNTPLWARIVGTIIVLAAIIYGTVWLFKKTDA